MIRLRKRSDTQEVSIISDRKRYSTPGTSPGTLRPPEVRRVEKVTITVIDYDANHYEERNVDTVDECFPYFATPTVTWINITGLHEIEIIQRLGEKFGLHPLALEDVLNTGQRPKMDDYDEQHFIVLREMQWKSGLEADQISLFLGSNYVITFQELEGDVFDPVRERLRKGKGRIRRMGPDYLVYALIDKVVDELFPILEIYGERLEEMEDELIQHPTRETLQEIHRIRRDLIALRRCIWPEREITNALQREESHLIRQETKVFLRDVYDHTIQIVEIIETYRDLAAGMLDVYLSSLSNRMNEIMKLLTIISTIFIPLTFIVGLYGMNFNTARSPWNMPELNWYWGYPVVVLAMLGVALLMVAYFRRKGWL
jgi:magnesium transporter